MTNKSMSNLNKTIRVWDLKETTTVSNSDVLLIDTEVKTLKTTKENLLKEVNEQLNAKSNSDHTHSEYMTEDSLNNKGLATETFVSDKITQEIEKNNAQLSQDIQDNYLEKINPRYAFTNGYYIEVKNIDDDPNLPIININNTETPDYSILQLEAPHNGCESTITLMRNFDGGAEFIDFTDMNYEGVRTTCLVVQSRGGGELSPFRFMFNKGQGRVPVLDIYPNGTHVEIVGDGIYVGGEYVVTLEQLNNHLWHCEDFNGLYERVVALEKKYAETDEIKLGENKEV